MENCLSFIKDNIQIKLTKLGLNRSNQLNLPITYIQVPSKFFEWLEEHYVKLLKWPLPKNLEKTQSYFIKLEWKTLMVQTTVYGNYQVPTEFYETSRSGCSIQKFKPRTQNFVIPGIRNLKIESQLKLQF
jgi:hypothetical protein